MADDETLAAVLRDTRAVLLQEGLAKSPYAGAHATRLRGQGIEFAEIRDYVPGDDVRAIDWNVSARHGRPFVRVCTEEREQTLYLMVDCSASMATGADVARWHTAVRIAASLILGAVRSGDRAGLLLYSDRVEGFYPARKGRRNALFLIQRLIDVRPHSKGSDMRPALRHFTARVPRESAVAVISDFLSPLPARELAVFARRHDVRAVEVNASHEHALPPVGLVWLEDPETGEAVLADTTDPVLREAYRRIIAEEERVLDDRFGRCRIPQIRVDAGGAWDLPLRLLYGNISGRRG
ncbi:hypothetical protein AZH53_09175 [Methanomicrobiaceae archaeon CYW5]|nr:hypothetical protein [Methanovulcanius yangii]